MATPGKADPAIYPELRARAMQIRLPNLPQGAVHAVLMDWNVNNGTITVLAGADGSASLYLSSGGGFIGGGQRSDVIRDAAFHAVQVASGVLPLAAPAEGSPLPPRGDIFFYVVMSEGLQFASAMEESLKAGSSPLAALGAAMQRIVTEYRLLSEKRS